MQKPLKCDCEQSTNWLSCDCIKAILALNDAQMGSAENRIDGFENDENSPAALENRKAGSGEQKKEGNMNQVAHSGRLELASRPCYSRSRLLKSLAEAAWEGSMPGNCRYR